MRIIQICLILILSISIGNSQKSVDNLFEKLSKVDGVVKMNLTGDVLDLLDDELTKGIGSKIDNIDILIMDNISSSFTKADYTSLKADLRSSNYEVLINARDNGSKIEVFVDEQGDLIKRLFLMLTSDDKNIMVKVKGNLKYADFKDIDLSGIDGLEMLNKIGEH